MPWALQSPRVKHDEGQEAAARVQASKEKVAKNEERGADSIFLKFMRIKKLLRGCRPPRRRWQRVKKGELTAEFLNSTRIKKMLRGCRPPKRRWRPSCRRPMPGKDAPLVMAISSPLVKLGVGVPGYALAPPPPPPPRSHV